MNREGLFLEIIEGKAYVLGDNIDTDQIIPAKHLVYSMLDPVERLNYGKFALSGLPADLYNVPFVSQGGKSEYSVVIGGRNFGCGSSREQAPAALKFAGVQVVLVQSYARIFYRNVIDAAFFTPLELKSHNINEFATGDPVSVDLEKCVIANRKTGKSLAFHSLGDAQPILDAGGIFPYARKNGWIRK